MKESNLLFLITSLICVLLHFVEGLSNLVRSKKKLTGLDIAKNIFFAIWFTYPIFLLFVFLYEERTVFSAYTIFSCCAGLTLLLRNDQRTVDEKISGSIFLLFFFSSLYLSLSLSDLDQNAFPLFRNLLPLSREIEIVKSIFGHLYPLLVFTLVIFFNIQGNVILKQKNRWSNLFRSLFLSNMTMLLFFIFKPDTIDITYTATFVTSAFLAMTLIRFVKKASGRVSDDYLIKIMTSFFIPIVIVVCFITGALG